MQELPMLEGTLPKFSLMNPDEFDRYEKLQASVFRPASVKDTPNIAKDLLKILDSGKQPRSGNPEGKLYVRITNALRSNEFLQSHGSVRDYISAVADIDIKNPTMTDLITLDRLKLDTNKGSFYQSQYMDYEFEDGSKATEKEAKDRLMKEFGVSSEDFLLLPDAGPEALFIDDDTKEIRSAANIKVKRNRSIDAIIEFDDKVIAVSMKYKGGTAGVGGSGQSDQGTTEGKESSKLFETAHKKGKEFTYKGKPVFYASLVYGSQFNDPKRIVENELAFRTDYRCYRSFNISLTRVADLINYFKTSKEPLDDLLQSVYNKYGYDINYRGNPKGTTKQRLTEWIK